MRTTCKTLIFLFAEVSGVGAGGVGVLNVPETSSLSSYPFLWLS